MPVCRSRARHSSPPTRSRSGSASALKRIDRARREVVLGDGGRLRYDHLALATGARNRIPPIPGLDRRSILELRTLKDARAAERTALGFASCDDCRRRVHRPGGCQPAARARRRCRSCGGHARTDGARTVRSMSAFFRSFHEEMGTRLHFETLVREVSHGSASARLWLSNDSHIDTDAILIAAGVVANAQLAAEAGLEVDNGIVVDDRLLTSDPAISAMGDCVSYPNVHTGGMARLESVQNAVDQARSIAARLTGDDKPYDGLPWFWSNQGSARLQIAGLSNGHDDTVLRGDPGSGKVLRLPLSRRQADCRGEHQQRRRPHAGPSAPGYARSVPKAVAANSAINLKESDVPKAVPARSSSGAVPSASAPHLFCAIPDGKPVPTFPGIAVARFTPPWLGPPWLRRSVHCRRRCEGPRHPP